MSKVLQVDPDDEEHLQLAQGLPFLDLSNADNTRIWWAIREYAIVDSLDERVDLEIVLGVVLFYTTTMSLYLIVDVVLSGKPTAFTVVALFDLVVIGAMVLSSLFSCVQVNELLRSHTHTFLRARHSLWCPESKVLGMADNEIAEILDVDDDVALAAFSPGASSSLKDSQRLHSHLIEKIEHSDTLQTVYGVEVTMDNIGQLVVAIGCAIASAVFSIQRSQNKMRRNARKHVRKARDAARQVRMKATGLLALPEGHIDATAALPAIGLAARVIGAVQRVDAMEPHFLASTLPGA